MKQQDIDRMLKRFCIKKATPALIEQFERLLTVENKRNGKKEEV